jgi:hypothetical protein
MQRVSGALAILVLFVSLFIGDSIITTGNRPRGSWIARRFFKIFLATYEKVNLTRASAQMIQSNRMSEPPRRKDAVIRARVPVEMKAQLSALARERAESPAVIVREALRLYLEKVIKRKPAGPPPTADPNQPELVPA